MWYIYKIREISEARFAVRANSQKEAEAKVYAWEEEHHEEVREHLNEYCISEDSIEEVFLDKQSFSNWCVKQPDHYGYDFLAEDEPPLLEQQDRCLHIRFKDGSNPVVCYGMTITGLAQKIAEWGVNYILVPDPDGPGCVNGKYTYLLAEKRTIGRYSWGTDTAIKNR